MKIDEIRIPAKMKLSPATEKASKDNWERLKKAVDTKRAKKHTMRDSDVEGRRKSLFRGESKENKPQDYIGKAVYDREKNRDDRVKDAAKKNPEKYKNIKYGKDRHKYANDAYIKTESVNKSTAIDHAFMLIEKLSAENKAKREAARGPQGRAKQTQRAKQTSAFDYKRPQAKRVSSLADKTKRREFSRNAGKKGIDPLHAASFRRTLKTKFKHPTFTARNSPRTEEIVIHPKLDEGFGFEIKGFSKSGVKPTPADSPKQTTPGKTYRDSMGVKNKVISYSNDSKGTSRHSQQLHSTTKTFKAIERLSRMKASQREKARPKAPKAMKNESFDALDRAFMLIEKLKGK